MTNYTTIDDTTITYNVSGSNDTIYLVRDENMIQGSARWNTLVDNRIYYNIPPFSKVDKINDTLEQIYSQYVKMGVFGKAPTPDSSLPAWVTFNPEDQSFYIRFSYVMSFSSDFSSIPTCKFYTSPSGNFKSSDYPYANKSTLEICGEESIPVGPSGIRQCQYPNGLFDIPQPSCPKYVADTSTIRSLHLKSKFSENKLNITASVSRMKMGAELHVVIEDKINKTVYHKLTFDALDKDQQAQISTEVDAIIKELLLSYEETFEITEEPFAETSVIIRKKSFISSLVEKDNTNVYV